MTGVFVAPAAGGSRFNPSPPAEEHEVEAPNPMNGAVLHTLGFGGLATVLEILEAGEGLSNQSGPRAGVFNENAIRPDAMLKPGNSFS